MKTITTVTRHHRRLRSVGILLIALSLAVIDLGPSRAEALGTTQSVIVTPSTTVPMLTGSLTPVNNSRGDQTNPRVNRDRVSYTNDDFAGNSLIHLFDFSTATDQIIPGNGLDWLSDVTDTQVAFTQLTALSDQIVVFDTTSQTSTIVSGAKCSNPALGGNLLTFEDRNLTDPNQSEIDVYDFNTASVTRLTNDGLFDKNPAVSPTGNAIVWEKCTTPGAGCDIYSAIQTSPGVFTTQALTDVNGEDRVPDTNGDIVVYTSNRNGETDIYYQPVAGGVETQLAIAGDQRDVRISGNLIVFESGTSFWHDVFVYDINTQSLYQVTNTPSDDERLSNISVWNGTGRVVWAVAGGFGDFDLYAFTFQIPSSVPSQINNLITLVQSFQLPHGIENSLVTKLQDALAALNTADSATACDSLRSFISQCSAQSGKALTKEQADQLINSATQIRTDLGCQ